MRVPGARHHRMRTTVSRLLARRRADLRPPPQTPPHHRRGGTTAGRARLSSLPHRCGTARRGQDVPPHQLGYRTEVLLDWRGTLKIDWEYWVRTGYERPRRPRRGSIHAKAQEKILRQVYEWKTGTGLVPKIYRKCFICGYVVWQPLPEKVAKVYTEQPVVARSRTRIADVVLLDEDDELLLVVEIFHTHAVSRSKLFDYGRIHFIELAAEEVLNAPPLWRPLRWHLNPFRCDCRRGGNVDSRQQPFTY